MLFKLFSPLAGLVLSFFHTYTLLQGELCAKNSIKQKKKQILIKHSFINMAFIGFQDLRKFSHMLK